MEFWLLGHFTLRKKHFRLELKSFSSTSYFIICIIDSKYYRWAHHEYILLTKQQSKLFVQNNDQLQLETHQTTTEHHKVNYYNMLYSILSWVINVWNVLKFYVSNASHGVRQVITQSLTFIPTSSNLLHSRTSWLPKNCLLFRTNRILYLSQSDGLCWHGSL